MALCIISKECGFRPHHGIIEFNKFINTQFIQSIGIAGFRPHQGIIEFNLR